MHAMLAAADALDEPAVVLLGEPSYYRRFGFVLAEPVGLLPPDPNGVPHFQVRPLHAWDDSLRGTFRYAPAFAPQPVAMSRARTRPVAHSAG